MTDKSSDVFFYGLFMDSDFLIENEVEAVNPRQAYADDFALRIGLRATLVPAPGARSYGMVFAMTNEDLTKLYGAPGLEQYRSETITVRTMSGESSPVLCYILNEAPRPNEANPVYAAQLRAVLSKLGFPPEYIATVS